MNRLSLVFLILLFALQSVAGTGAKTESHHVRFSPSGFLTILPYYSFIDLSSEKKKSYLLELRGFMAQQDAKWDGKPVALGSSFSQIAAFLTILDSAQAEDYTPVDCDLKDLDENQKQVTQGGKDKCIIGGFMVCLSKSAGRVFCTPNEPNFLQWSTRICQSGDKIPCAEPLYMSAQGGQLCIPRPAKAIYDNGKKLTITEQCNRASKIDDVVKKIESDPAKYKTVYEAFQQRVQGYCGKDGGNAHKFDRDDCRSLQGRLDKIQSIYGALKDGVLCDRKAKLSDGKEMEVRLIMDENGHYAADVKGDAHGWVVTKCSGTSQVDGEFSENKSPQTEPWQTCLARKDDNHKSVETIQFGEAGQKTKSCDVHYAVYSPGVLQDNGFNTCNAQLGDTYFFSEGNHHYLKKRGNNVDLQHLDHAVPDIYQTGNDKNGYTELFVNPDTPDLLSKCWARYRTTLNSQDLLQQTPAENSATVKVERVKGAGTGANDISPQ